MELKARPDLLVHADALPPGVEEVPLRGAVQVLPHQTAIIRVQIQGRDPVAADTITGGRGGGRDPAGGTRCLARRCPGLMVSSPGPAVQRAGSGLRIFIIAMLMPRHQG